MRDRNELWAPFAAGLVFNSLRAAVASSAQLPQVIKQTGRISGPLLGQNRKHQLSTFMSAGASQERE